MGRCELILNKLRERGSNMLQKIIVQCKINGDQEASYNGAPLSWCPFRAFT